MEILYGELAEGKRPAGRPELKNNFHIGHDLEHLNIATVRVV